MAKKKSAKAVGHSNVDRGHQYAHDVLSGKVVACKYVKAAAKRYLNDLVIADDMGWIFDKDAAEKYLRSVQKFNHPIGTWKTKNIVYEPWQCFVWMNIMGFLHKDTGFRRFRVAHVEIARGNAKALCLDTDVPTPDRGLVKFGLLDVGDALYATDGTICRITGRNQVHVPASYRVTFSDGTTVDCSDKHLWTTSSKGERRTETKSAKTTKEIFNSLKAGKETNHAVDNAMPVLGTRSDCQLGYVLGYWLGDGNSRSGRFTAHEDQFAEVKARFKSRKLHITTEHVKGKAVSFVVPALTYWLRELNLVNNKHIPEKYFMAPEEVRRELLRGLMDSDGTCSKAIGNFTFCNANERLARDTRRLIASLGYKATIRGTQTRAQNGFVGRAFYVTFSSPTTRPSIFGIRAKEDVRSARPTKYCNKRYITNVEKITDKPMFCIEVDSVDQNFLVTDQYIPTHNSTMASQAALYFLALDNPNGNQISTVATKKDQARIVLDAARFMASKNESFLKHTGVSVRAHSINHFKSNSTIRALASDSSGMDGLNDILAVLDELHAMKRDTFEVVTSGMSKRKDSLTLCITTAGKDVHSIGHSQSVYAKKVAMGEVEDQSFFSAVYCLDDGDDWEDSKVWIKSNPNFGISVDAASIQQKIEKALVSPSDIPNIKIKHLNMWIGEADAFYDQKEWDKCADPTLKIENFRGERCRMGLDLASHIDITSIAAVFRKDDKYYLFDRSYLPEETAIRERGVNALYDECIAKGFLIATPGAAINYDHIRNEAEQFAKDYRVQEMAFDPWNAVEMSQKLADKIEMVKFSMNVANFSEPMKKLDSLMRQGKIVHNGSPLLRWCIGNVVAKADHNDNVFPRKSHTKLKIDPVVAILMALALWLQDAEKDSIYDERGILVI